MGKTTLIFILIGILLVGGSVIAGTLFLIHSKMKESRRKEI